MKLLLTFLLIILMHFLFAQDIETVELIGDRPDQTESSTVLPKGYFQFENGFVNENVNSYLTNISYSSFLVRYGLFENFELRFASDYQMTKITGLDNISGFAPISVGSKIQVKQEDGWIPQIAFLGHLTIANTGNSDYMQKYQSANMVLTFGHTLNNYMYVGYSIGVDFPSDVDYSVGTYTFVTGFTISNKIGAFIEAYGDFSKYMYAQNKINGGVTYLIHPQLQLDFAGGFGLSEYSANSYYSFGLIYLFKI